MFISYAITHTIYLVSKGTFAFLIFLFIFLLTFFFLHHCGPCSSCASLSPMTHHCTPFCSSLLCFAPSFPILCYMFQSIKKMGKRSKKTLRQKRNSKGQQTYGNNFLIQLLKVCLSHLLSQKQFFLMYRYEY